MVLNRLKSLSDYRALRAAIGFEPGHFYSPYPDIEELRPRFDALADTSKTELSGVDVRTKAQLDTLARLCAIQRPTMREIGFEPDNDAFRAGDALLLIAQIMAEPPRRIVEIGSGHSTALIQKLVSYEGLDLHHTVIDPYPGVIFDLIEQKDMPELDLRRQMVQDVSPALLDDFCENDILFVDSSHVSKAGSDVNTLVFDWLPRLPKGARVHFHDIHFPFEPRWDWIEQARAWTEGYLLRAFLSFNSDFSIELFNDQLRQQNADKMAKLGVEYERSGSSLWIRRTAA